MTMTTGTAPNENNHNYPALEQAVRHNYSANVMEGTRLFTTDAGNLFELFLHNLPAEARQYYTCRACANFVNRFGGLVTIGADSTIKPVMWDLNAPTFFLPSVNAVIEAVKKAEVTGVFLSEEKVWGQPQTGEWTHMSVTQLPKSVYTSRLMTAGQKMAEKREDYRMLQEAIQSYSLPTIQQAVTLLKSEVLYRSEKTLGVAEWFLKLAESSVHVKNLKTRNNAVWLAVATAPAGFAHVRSSMIGTLLDDIQSGMEFESVKKRFSAKMNPLQYQRPQAASSAGNIAQAEKIFEKLGLAPSLERRFARLDEIETIWKPALPKNEQEAGGLFGHLKAKDAPTPAKAMTLPTVTMTWRKFLETVLPNAEVIEYQVRSGTDVFTALLTAVNADAPPILQWDTEERRNPVNWYVYSGGSAPSQWGLTSGWCKVTGITYQPSMWYEENAHQGKAVIFILDGARDNRAGRAGIALFPETLKSELREVRSTIESYSKNAQLGGYEEASACGIRLQSGAALNATIRVTAATGTASYKLDRWD